MAACKDNATSGQSVRSGLSSKELARSLGLISKLSSSSSSKANRSKKRQPFQYLVIIDFESTCWKDKRMSYAPEIIEFPAVLLNTSTGIIESEFQHYVQPSEHKKLSDFCKELTGITQAQVDGGIPIGTCLLLFSRWLKDISEKKRIQFLCDALKHSESAQNCNDVKWCTFVTWSDWDIGICLKKECERKRHRVPPPLRAWIDLRETYKTFYSRKPNGLAGAMKDTGIQFAGRQHCGLDDARNTAKLSWRMIKDGCVMNVTSSIDVSVDILHQIIKNGFKRSEHLKDNKIFPGNGGPVKDDPGTVIGPPYNDEDNKKNTITTKSSTSTHQMVSPIVSVVDSSLGNGQGGHGIAALVTPDNKKSTSTTTPSTSTRQLLSPIVSVIGSSPGNGQGGHGITSLVTPVTSLGKHSDLTGKKLLGSFQSVDKNLQKVGTCMQQSSKEILNVTPYSVKCPVQSGNGRTIIPTNNHGIARQSLGVSSPTSGSSLVNVSSRNVSALKRPAKSSNLSVEVKKTPRLVDCTNIMSRNPINVVTNFQHCGLDSTKKFGNHCGQNTPKSLNSVNKTSTFKTPKITTPFSGNFSVTPLSNGTPLLRYNAGSVTPPLCDCGRRSRRLTVSKVGPNQGRVFYTCPVKKSRSSFGKSPVKVAKTKLGCKFFCWEPR